MGDILLIDNSAEDRQNLIRAIGQCLPEIFINEYDPARGIPGPDFDWSQQSLILLDYDLGLPDITGLNWLQALRKFPGVPPIILMLSKTDTNVALNALRLGAVNYLVKTELDKASINTKISESLQSILLNVEDLSIFDISGGEQSDEDKTVKATEGYDATIFAPPQVNNQLTIPGYTIIREIAKGGMSTVLLASREEDNLEVILKVMFLDGNEDQQALKRFIQEYNLLSNLDNPHIVKIYERAFASNFAYIAMEYFPNGDLNVKIKRGITPEKARDYLRQMVIGLRAAHELNIVHRDLKPGNVLFRDDDTLTITDFGVAKIVSDDDDITINNSIVGTPYYLSPEQGSGLKVDHRSDLYSLGIIFYQMLTGKRPYTADSIQQLVYAHTNNPIPVLRGELAKYQPLIEGLLAKDPNDRFQNCRDLLLGIDWIK